MEGQNPQYYVCGVRIWVRKCYKRQIVVGTLIVCGTLNKNAHSGPKGPRDPCSRRDRNPQKPTITIFGGFWRVHCFGSFENAKFLRIPMAILGKIHRNPS